MVDANGAVVQGKVANGAGEISSGNAVQDIQIDKSLKLPAVKTQDVSWSGNLQSSSATIRTNIVAFTGNLKKENMKVDISQYCLLSGVFINNERYLNTYFKYRVDKACGYYLPRENVEEKVVNIAFSCDLVEPYSVYVK